MKIFYLISDNGDGSSSVHFFKNYESAAALVDDEWYYANEGDVRSFEIPDGPRIPSPSTTKSKQYGPIA